jgi:sec-independent protein translocase protein TatC
LRACLINAVLAWATCCVVVGVFSPTVLKWLKSPAEALMKAGKLEIVSLNITGCFAQIMSIAMWGGTALSFPFTMFAILRFVFPALTKREKVVLLTILVIGTGFFISGVWLAYRETLPVMLKVFKQINEWIGMKSEVYFASDYMPVILKTLFAFGLIFQVPLIIFVLGWFGVISSAALRAKRRIAIVMSFVISMLLTPPDPMSQIIMAVPLCILYEVATWAVWFKEKASFKKG